MIRDRLRRGARRVKNGLKRRLLGDEVVVQAPPATAPVQAKSTSTPVTAPEPVAPPEPVEPPEPIAPEQPPHPPLTMEVVEALMDDMVRPALQADGGDLELVKVEDNDVHVRLVGACSTCPSSTVTMKMGIERLLVEEFPQFRNLIQVMGPA